MEQYDAVIIGAGPAGMMAAIRAGQRGRRTLLIERNNTCGRKLLISGAGRCNLTNSGSINDFLSKFSSSRDFLRNVFHQFFNDDLISFFENSRLKLKTEPDGRMFPSSGKARDVLDVLTAKLKNKNVKILFGRRLRDVIVKNKRIEGVIIDSKKYFSSSAVIATGGLSYSQTGSSGDGYRIAAILGHNIVPLKPALSPLFIRERFIKEWQGIALRGVAVALICRDKVVEKKSGDMLFTHFGLSGPVIFDISAAACDILESGVVPRVSINFSSGLDYKKLDARLLKAFKSNSRKNIKNALTDFLPQGIIKRFLEYCGVNENKGTSQVAAQERERIINAFLDFRVTIEGVMPVKNSIVTRGGVDTREINPKTMESKIIAGLFFAGEVIDIDAKTGGYNMQAAFSTGWVCGGNI